MNASHVAALEGFDRLPDSSHVRAPVVAAILGVSVPTVWRWSAAGKLGQPTRPSKGTTAWNVGAVRGLMKTARA